MMKHISGDKAPDYSQGEVELFGLFTVLPCILIDLSGVNNILIYIFFNAFLQLSGLLKELGYTKEMVYKF